MKLVTIDKTLLEKYKEDPQVLYTCVIIDALQQCELFAKATFKLFPLSIPGRGNS